MPLFPPPTTSGALPLTGGTLTGDIVISKASPTVFVNRAASGTHSRITGQVAGLNRWAISLGTSDAETGANAGSAFTVYSYSDTGTFIASPLTIARSTSDMQLAANLTLLGATATKASGTTWANPSDERIKEDVQDYPVGLDSITKLRPVTYKFKRETGYSDEMLAQRQYGLIAQEAEQVMPSLVTSSKGGVGDLKFDDFKSLDASNIIWALINAVKELAARVDELQAQVKA